MKRISIGTLEITDKERQALFDVIDSDWLTEGPKVHEFEKAFASYIGVKNGIAVNSGGSAITTGLTTLLNVDFLNQPYGILKIYKGSKVLTSPITFIATVHSIVAAGLTPVFVDIEEETYNIDPAKIAEHDMHDISIIMPVHLFGIPANMSEITKIATENEIVVCEDAAEAHGTMYKGKRVGSMSTMSFFSFYAAHTISSIEGGMILTNDDELSSMMKSVRAHGRACTCERCLRPEGKCPYKLKEDFDRRFHHPNFGYSSKMNELEAAVGLSQLQRIDEITKKRRENVKYLNDELEGYDELRLPTYSKDTSYMAYPIVLNGELSRKEVTDYLEKNGIETRPIFGCIPTQQPAYAHLKKTYRAKLPIAEHVGKNGFFIGCHQGLTEDDLSHVVSTLGTIL